MRMLKNILPHELEVSNGPELTIIIEDEATGLCTIAGKHALYICGTHGYAVRIEETWEFPVEELTLHELRGVSQELLAKFVNG